MINLRLFSNSTFTWSSITRLLGFVGSSAAFFLMPIFLQSFLGYQEIAAGMVMFVGAFGMGVASQFSGRLSDRFGFRSFTFIGLGMLVAAALMFSFFDGSTPAWVIMPVLFFNGLGMGMWMAPNMSATLGAVERQHYGSVSAFVNLVRNIGSVFGQALTSAIVAGVMLARGADVQLSELATSTNPAVKQAFVDGWRYAYLVLAAFTLMALYAAWKTRANPEPQVAAPMQPAGQPASRTR
jgi:MFS family permease